MSSPARRIRPVVIKPSFNLRGPGRLGPHYYQERKIMKRGKPDDWIPLWIDKWLYGSTRIELNPAERSVWVDLMALAGKDDGYIRANETTPYPPRQLAGMFCVSIPTLESAIEKCLKFQKLERFDSGILRILNWDQYSLSYRHKSRIINSCPENETGRPVNQTPSLSPSLSNSLSSSRGKKEGGEEKARLNLTTWEWENISDADMRIWAEAYPAVDINLALKQMAAWCKDHQSDGKGRKSNWAAFITRWLKKEQDKGGNRGRTNTKPSNVDIVKDWATSRGIR